MCLRSPRKVVDIDPEKSCSFGLICRRTQTLPGQSREAGVYMRRGWGGEMGQQELEAGGALKVRNGS